MESDFNLESLREISESQLEVLLRYDSPPETPSQPTNPIRLNSGYFQTDLNANENNVEDNSCSSTIHYNREQLPSQIDSQIDFSIFHRHSSYVPCSLSPFNMQFNENENSILFTSALDSAEITDISIRDEDKNDLRNVFIESNKSENSFTHKKFNTNKTHTQTNSVKICPYSCPQRTHNYDEGDNIIRNNGNISNFDLPHMYNREWKTQLKSKSHLRNADEKIISSCPPEAGKNYMLDCIPSHSKKYGDNLKSFFRNSVVMDKIEFNSADLSISSPNLFENYDYNRSKSDDKTGAEGNTLEETPCIPNSHKQDLDQEQSRPQITKNSRHLFHDDFSKDRSQPCTNVKNSSYANLLMNASSIPSSVRQLYDIVKTNYSDFAFIYALSSQLCQDRVPMECFVTLKMALLLSLVSIGNNENRPPIPIVAITNDAYMTEYLMSNIGQLGSRFLGAVDEHKYFSNMNWIDADSILLAQGGVYYAGDWTRLKLKKSETIFKNIECSNVAVEKSTLSFPIETAIWTHWRAFKHGAKDQQTFNKFLKIFGIPIFVSDDNHETLVDYTLEQSSVRVFESTVDHLSINEDDMRNFLICVSRNNVDLSPEAAILLKNYYVASRSIRKDCLSQQSYTVLKQFAESFAKLSMRKVVLTGDAVAAIIICEHSIENIFSSSDNSPPHFGNFTFVGTVDKYLLQFEEWLASYIEKFSGY